MDASDQHATVLVSLAAMTALVAVGVLRLLDWRSPRRCAACRLPAAHCRCRR